MRVQSKGNTSTQRLIQNLAGIVDLSDQLDILCKAERKFYQGKGKTRGSMAQVNVPDDPNWQRIFKALARFAGKRGRISRECQIEIHAGKNGVKTAAREEDYSPDE